MKTINTLILISILLISTYCTGCNTQNSANVSVKDILEQVQSEAGTIEGFEIATEKTDSNNLLNKQGGYVELGWFFDSRIEKDMEKTGTARGGAIEKFKTEKEAKKRDEYLASFDGTMLRSGYHEQCGVFVIRVSNELIASEQKEIAEKIKKAFSSNK